MPPRILLLALAAGALAIARRGVPPATGNFGARVAVRLTDGDADPAAVVEVFEAATGIRFTYLQPTEGGWHLYAASGLTGPQALDGLINRLGGTPGVAAAKADDALHRSAANP